MIRTQIQLTTKQMEVLRAESKRQQLSIAEIIRQAIDASLVGSIANNHVENKKRAIAICGQFASGLADVSQKHDDYLDEAFGDIK
ncbi:MAG: ribbon-helix-helix protein, CopG family [Deltaproteobacteria bacterium]|nr:ribbon-helix-helix protein, CopG family [Deltaproteobacteria bacterium]